MAWSRGGWWRIREARKQEDCAGRGLDTRKGVERRHEC